MHIPSKQSIYSISEVKLLEKIRFGISEAAHAGRFYTSLNLYSNSDSIKQLLKDTFSEYKVTFKEYEFLSYEVVSISWDN